MDAVSLRWQSTDKTTMKTDRAKSIRSRLASHYLLPVAGAVLVLVLASALYFVYTDTQQMRETLNADFSEQQLILGRQAAAQIGGHLDDVAAELARLEPFVVGARGRPELRELLELSLGHSRGIGLFELGVIDQSGNFVETVSVYGVQPEDSTKHSIVRQLRETHQRELGSLHVRPAESGANHITAYTSTRVHHPEMGEITLYAAIDVTRLVRAVTQGIRSGATGSAWVIDENGVFLYHVENEFVGKNAFTARHEREPYISFNKINEIMRDRMLQGEEGTGTYISGWHRGVAGEVEKLLAFTPVRTPVIIPGRLWSVAVSAPVSEVNLALDNVRRRHFLVEAAVVLAMLGFASLVTIYHTRFSQALKVKMSQQQEYLSAILQNSVDAIVFIDNGNQVQVWNRGAEMIFGYTAEEMIGSRFRRLIPPDVDAERELGRIMEEVYEKGHIRNFQTQRLTKSGKRITVNISRTLIHDKEGAPIGSTAVIKDVTDKVEMDKHIYNTEKLASIGTLAAGVAHEINNPLAIILGFTDLLKQRFREGASELNDLKMIEDNANMAKKTIENLLGFARVSEGFEDTADVGSALEKVINITKNTLLTKKIELVTDIDPSLPCIAGDAREFQQVVFNLINNATSAMRDEGGTLRVSAACKDGWVRVRVQDSGVGIPDRIKAQIFDPFFTTKNVGEGTGLGLSLCYGIVQKYGGKMEFTSISKEDEPDKPSGTTFTVSMPATPADEIGAPPQAS
jgi:PAS domain S-box-containing protein